MDATTKTCSCRYLATWIALLTLLAATLTCETVSPFIGLTVSWTRHTIDDSSRGADGVRLGDVNSDGLMDLVVAWEDAGEVRVYLHPGVDQVRTAWPSVRVGRVGSVEDAVFVDLDGDGATDVVSCCEGDVRSIFVHWAPTDPSQYLDSTAWQTESLPAASGAMKWMFCVPMQVDGIGGIDLVCGAKGDDAKVGWFKAPSNPRNLSAWTWHVIADAGWIMSLIPMDVDDDGDIDVVATDRKGESRGTYWFENPGPGFFQVLPWPRHRIGTGDDSVMFMDWADLDADGLEDAVVATSEKAILFHRRGQTALPSWSTYRVALSEQAGTGKGLGVADVNLDGRQDIVFSCEGAGGKTGIAYLSYMLTPFDPAWLLHPISDEAGGKFDQVQLLDVDNDGDLDVITTEEGAGLGVIWYENPTR